MQVSLHDPTAPNVGGVPQSHNFFHPHFSNHATVLAISETFNIRSQTFGFHNGKQDNTRRTEGCGLQLRNWLGHLTSCFPVDPPQSDNQTPSSRPLFRQARAADVRFRTSHPTSERSLLPDPWLPLAESATLLPERWYINCMSKSWIGSWIGYSRIFATAYAWFVGTRASAP